MIERLYADNYRCLTKCEIKFGRVALLLGPNGSGKSTVLDLTQALQQFVGGLGAASTVFPSSQLTKWQTLDNQIFELDLRSDLGVYRYALTVQHSKDRSRNWVSSESLTLEGRPLLQFANGDVQLYNDRHEAGPVLTYDLTRSALNFINPRRDNTKLTEFKLKLASILPLRPCPPIMRSDSSEEANTLDIKAENFVSWYRYASRQDFGAQLALLQEMRLVMEGFDSLHLDGPADATATLKASFRTAENGSAVSYKFNELSDGQRQLFVLYTLLYGLSNRDRILFLDEADNYVSLREIQPWLTAVMDATGRSISQVILISHHAEIVDHLAPERGIWFARDANGAARVSYDRATDTAPLRPSEVEARGWTHE